MKQTHQQACVVGDWKRQRTGGSGGDCGTAMRQPLRWHQASDREKAWEGLWLREAHGTWVSPSLGMAEGRSPRSNQKEGELMVGRYRVDQRDTRVREKLETENDCGGCMRIEVQSEKLIDGTVVCDSCERLAFEREATYIVRCDDKQTRRDELDLIERTRGKRIRQSIEAVVLKLWPMREQLL